VVVRLDDGRGDLGGRGDGEGKLRLATVVDGQALKKKGAEARARSTAGGVEDHEALETSAVVRELADAVKHEDDNFLADCVVTTGVVVGGILLAGDELLRVIQLTVGASSDLVTDTGLEVNKDGTRDMLSSISRRKRY
jgi:hypothetical protein